MLPKQKIPDSEKDKDWGAQCIEYLIRNVNDDTFNNEYDRRLRNYNLVNGIQDSSEYDYLTGFSDTTNGTRLEYPAEFRNFNIIKPVVETLKGEYILKDPEYGVLANNESAINEKRDIIHHLRVRENMKKLTDLYASVGFSEKDTTDYAGMEQAFYKKGGKIRVEAISEKIISSLYKKLYIKNKFIEGLNDLIIVDAVIYKIEGGPGWTDFRRVNTLDCWFLLNKDTPFLHDSFAVVERRYMTANDVLDYYDDYLTEEEKDSITSYTSSNTASTYYNNTNTHSRRIDDVYNFCIYECEWRSFTEVFLLETTEDTGRVISEVVDKRPAKLAKNQKIKRTWITCIWEGVKIDNFTYCKIQRKEVEYRRIDDINQCELSYTGIISTHENCIPVSIVDTGAHYQYLYNTVWIKLQHEIAAATGKVIKLDTAQLPRSQNITLEKWLYYLKASKIYIFNSLETDENGNRSSYNQMGSEDMSISASIQHYLTILQFVRTEFERAAGVPPQRQGSVHQNETVGGVERSISQSSAITEWLNHIHGQVCEHVLRKLIHQFQHSHKDGKSLQYILPDHEIGFIDYNPDELSNYDLDVYITSANEVSKHRQKLEQATMMALQSGRADVTDLISIIRSNNLSDIEEKLKLAIKNRADSEQKMAQEQMKATSEENAAKLQLERDKIEAQIKIKEMDGKIKMQLADKEIQYQIRLDHGKLNQRQSELYANQAIEAEKRDDDLEKELGE